MTITGIITSSEVSVISGTIWLVGGLIYQKLENLKGNK